MRDRRLTKQALAQALEPLRRGGYVDVAPDPGDRRARVVRLTPRGREVVAAIQDVQSIYEARWAARVGQERWNETRQVLLELFAG